MEQNYPFDVPGDYQFPATIEVAGSKSALSDQKPANAIAYASYNTNENLNWGAGTLAGVLGGSAIVSGGQLDLTGGNAYCEYNDDNLATMLQTGCIRIRWRPNYTGSAPAVQEIIQTCSSTTNRVHIRHNTNILQCYIYNSSGVLMFNMSFVFEPNAGQLYELELNFDATIGIARFFINGQLQDSDSNTGIRSFNNLFRLGANSGTSCYVDAIIIYDTVQHTSNYTPNWSGIPETPYVLTNPKIYPDTSLRTDGISNIVLTSSITGSDELRFTMEVDGIEKYWTGSAWATSTGYAQTNTLADIITNLPTLITAISEIRWVMYLHSEDGSTTPEASNILVTYSFAGQDKDTVETCVVWWYMAENRTVNIFLKNDRVKYKTNVLLHREDYNIEKVADSTEYCEVELPDTVNMELDELGNEQVYVVLLDGERHEVNVPNQDGALLFDLL